MKLHHKIVTAITALTLGSSLLIAQNTKSSFSIEIDPSTYAFSGYALHIKKRFSGLPNWQFGIGSYAMDFPSVLVNTSAKNRDRGWSQRLDLGIGLFVDYFFKENQQGWFTGLQLAHQVYKITQKSNSSQYTTFLTMGYIGYQYELDNGIYIKPWIGIGSNNKISGSNEVNGAVFEVPNIIIFPTIHVGYKF